MAESIYKQAYEMARDELSQLVRQQDAIEKRIVVLRQNLQSLAALCESEGVDVQASPEAMEIRKSSTFADDVRAILQKYSPDFIRPQLIKMELQELGWDLAEQKNPLATIYSLLNRMVQAGDVEEDKDSRGNRVFAWIRLVDRISAGRGQRRFLYVEDRLSPDPNPKRMSLTEQVMSSLQQRKKK